MTSGERIKYLLKQKNMTQAQLAKMLNTTPQRLTEWISKNRQPSTKYLEQMAKIFEVSIDYILTGEEKETKNENYPNNIKELKSLTEQKIIEDYRSLDDEGKKQLKNFFDYLKNKYIKK